MRELGNNDSHSIIPLVLLLFFPHLDEALSKECSALTVSLREESGSGNPLLVKLGQYNGKLGLGSGAMTRTRSAECILLLDSNDYRTKL